MPAARRRLNGCRRGDPRRGALGGGGRRGRIWCRRRPIVARRRRLAAGPDATVAQLCRRLKNAGGSGPVIAEQRAVERRAAVCGRCWTPRRPLTAALTTVDDSERRLTGDSAPSRTVSESCAFIWPARGLFVRALTAGNCRVRGETARPTGSFRCRSCLPATSYWPSCEHLTPLEGQSW